MVHMADFNLLKQVANYRYVWSIAGKPTLKNWTFNSNEGKICLLFKFYEKMKTTEKETSFKCKTALKY